jgi:hypothetical protein
MVGHKHIPSKVGHRPVELYSTLLLLLNRISLIWLGWCYDLLLLVLLQ